MIRRDDLGNGYTIYQDTDAFCFGMDAVLLAHFSPLSEGERVLDLCTGNGIVPILMAADLKKAGRKALITGLEIQEAACGLAGRSVRENGLDDTISIVQGDIKEASDLFGKDAFSFISCNPPYMPGGHGLINEANAKTIARHEVLCTLEDIIAQSAKLLRMRGRFVMIHRPFRLAEMFTLMCRYGIEPKRVRMVYPYLNKEPNLVLVEGVRGGRKGLRMEPPLIVYREDGRYTEELLRIYGMTEEREKT